MKKIEICKRIENGELNFDRSYPGGAYYDYKTGYHYNLSGDQLRDISEYDTYSEGYTPFGDE